LAPEIIHGGKRKLTKGGKTKSGKEMVSGPETEGPLIVPNAWDSFFLPEPHQRERPWSRWIVRCIAGFGSNRIHSIRGFENISGARDPFILALNHTQKIEAPIVPAVLGILRQGKMIRFIADWNLMLVPMVYFMYRAGQVIVLDRKSAKPNFLNILRPYLTSKTPAFDRAQELIDEGHSIGIFPEGTTNSDSQQLLRGFSGAAKLAIMKGVPVVPAGIRFPNHRGTGPVREFEPMTIEIGHPLPPPEHTMKPRRRVVHDFHSVIMQEIARLSGKSWQPQSSRTKACLAQKISP
jgi:1-acyl-sn-glycerol-3-phosphate acyltransferase